MLFSVWPGVEASVHYFEHCTQSVEKKILRLEAAAMRDSATVEARLQGQLAAQKQQLHSQHAASVAKQLDDQQRTHAAVIRAQVAVCYVSRRLCNWCPCIL